MTSFSSVISAMESLSDAQYQREVKNLEAQGLTRQEFDKKKELLDKKQAAKNKQFAKAEISMLVTRAVADVYAMAIKSGKDFPGGPAMKALAIASTIAMGMMQVAKIKQTKLQTGTLGDTKRSRQSDTINAQLGIGETVVSAPQTAMHEDTLRAIQNNTANTAEGMKRIGRARGGDTINFYSASTETTMQVINSSRRRRLTGTNRI